MKYFIVEDNMITESVVMKGPLVRKSVKEIHLKITVEGFIPYVNF